MPILIEPSPDAPLNQGDILKDISLFETDGDWARSDAKARKIKSTVCMVLSRPCVAYHKSKIVVASIERNTGGVPTDANTFEKARQFLEQLRDGFSSPDRFYLGQNIPTIEQEGRFFARLDSLHTVRLPALDALPEHVRRHRIATLSEDFSRDLHRRVFSAFATLGFDDYGWYSTQDLDWLIALGRKELVPLQGEIRDKDAEIAKNTSSGETAKNPPITQQREKLQRSAKDLADELSKYEKESEKRGAPPP